jgi:thiamine biosynthesis lipoprotein
MRHAEHVMGTVVSFDLRPGELDARALSTALELACAALHAGDEQLSTWKPGSPLSRVRRGELALDEAPAAVAEVLRRCAEARELSGGWFDPWRLAGGVDPTGLAKGWIAERALEQLRLAGVGAAMVNAGGDVVAFGEPEPGRRWRIGVVDPRGPGALLGVVELDGAVATSGTNERGDHVLDPRSGLPARELLSATVTGPDLALADALSTGLLAAGEPGLAPIESLPAYEGLGMRHDGTTFATAGFTLEPLRNEAARRPPERRRSRLRRPRSVQREPR